MDATQRMYVRKASAGTGKTYTLAAHYIALLLHGEHYRSILAVTFTNKATAEMKDRIIEYLYLLSHFIEQPSAQAFLRRVRDITAELEYDAAALTDSYCQQRSLYLHQDLMIHYDEMRILTIDSFLQGLLKGMVLQLNGAVGYDMELDTQHVISDAVDDLLTQGAHDPAICRQLTRYIDCRIEEGKNWDIRQGLCEIGEEIFKELLQQHEDQLVFSPQQLHDFSQSIQWQLHAPVDELREALQAAQRFTKDDFAYGEVDVVRKVATLLRQLDGNISTDADAFVGFSARLMNNLGKYTPAIQDEIQHIQSLTQACRKAYLHDKWCTRFLNDLILMGCLKQRIEARLADTNTRLLSTTANTLYKALKGGDADFILEKAGICYKHIMLDEFQDTSSLQWENFLKLLRELLSTTQGSTLIVGDVKQSIYRWRNGNWQIMQGLPVYWADYYNQSIQPLVRNFRSSEQVVRFNLDTMRYVYDHVPELKDIYDEHYDGTNLQDYYLGPDGSGHPHHQGGLVRLRCYTQSTDKQMRQQVRQHILQDMFLTINEQLLHGTPAGQIMLLIRYNREGRELLDAYQRFKLQQPDAPLSHTPIISPNCFQLQYSPTVNLLVCAIRYIYTDDRPSLCYVQLKAPSFDITDRRFSLRSMALTDLSELLIHECVLTSSLPVDDLSYLNSFRDQLKIYVQQHGSSGQDFLRYWDDKMARTTIPAVSTAGIQMMTIHAAKGLEAANVFIPFCDWELEEDKKSAKLWCPVPELTTDNGQPAWLPVPQNKCTAEAGFQSAYEEEHFLQRVDNLNLLYVALTRAAERLFIYADVLPPSKSHSPAASALWRNVAQLLAERCQLWPELLAMHQNEQVGGENDYVEQVYGDIRWQSPVSSQHTSLNPLSFQHLNQADIHTSMCHSTDSRIEFRQSRSTLTVEQTALGTICHDVLSTLTLYPSIEQATQAAEQAVDRAWRSGVIPTEDMHQRILQLVCSTVCQLSQWFTGDWYIQREEAVLLRNRDHEVEERRMDRVMWSPDRTRAIVLDYKFGQDNVKYEQQVQLYMDICRRMGAQSVEGYLWIAAENKLEQI